MSVCLLMSRQFLFCYCDTSNSFVCLSFFLLFKLFIKNYSKPTPSEPTPLIGEVGGISC